MKRSARQQSVQPLPKDTFQQCLCAALLGANFSVNIFEPPPKEEVDEKGSEASVDENVVNSGEETQVQQNEVLHARKAGTPGKLAPKLRFTKIDNSNLICVILYFSLSFQTNLFPYRSIYVASHFLKLV